MFKISLSLCLVAAVSAQLGHLSTIVRSTQYQIDTLHGHVVQYDDRHDLLLLVGRETCYLVDAPDATWDSIAHSPDVVPRITEGIYRQIRSGQDMRRITHHDASVTFHSQLERFECRNRDVYQVFYTPPNTQ